MNDGKVASSISETSSLQVCIICGAFSKKIKKILYVYSLTIKKTIVQYGIFTLHCWIHCVEMFLEISYRLDFKTYLTRGEQMKKIVSEKKSLIRLNLDIFLFF